MARDIIIWVGKSFYRKKEDFLDEASRLGAMRRVPKVPDVEVGKSRCFLIYEEEKGKPVVFAYFTINSIGYVVRKGTNVPEELEKRGVKPISVGSGGPLPRRGCGQIVVGAVYILSEEDFEKCKDLAESSELSGSVMVLDPPVPWEGKHFRGYRYVDGDALLEGVQVKQLKRRKGKWKERYKTLDMYQTT